MRMQPVRWHEGMFLRPHHFQASDRYWAEHIRVADAWSSHYQAGVRSLVIDDEALANNKFRIERLHARLDDGTIIRVPQDLRIEDVDLTPHFRVSTRDEVTVSIGVPAYADNLANLARDKSDPLRYLLRQPIEDLADEETGQTMRKVQFRQPNVRLLFTDDVLEGMVALPIAKVLRSTRGEAKPSLSRDFVPPLLACDAWEPFRIDFLRAIDNQVGERLRDLAGKLVDRGINLRTTESEARELLEQVRLLNEISAITNFLCVTDGLSPLTAHQEYVRLIGQLAIVGPTRVPPPFPRYDHDRPGESFGQLRKIILEYLKLFGTGKQYWDVPFEGRGNQMRVKMEPEWIARGLTMYIGVKSDLPRDEVRAILTSGLTNMKIASPTRVETVYQRGFLGLDFNHTDQVPTFIPHRDVDTFFTLDRSEEEWPQIEKSHEVSLRMNEKIYEGGSLDGKRSMKLTANGGSLEFTLYIIKPKA